jgi:hypothetical protein
VYSSSAPSVAVINSITGLVTIVGVGAASIIATQSATATHTVASISATLSVAKAVPVVGELILPTTSHRVPAFTLVAPTSTSPATFSYTSSNTSVATVNAATGEVLVLSQGTTTITANQADSPTFAAASRSSQLVVASPPCSNSAPLVAGVVEVSNLSDSGAGSLRDALTIANASQSINTINFACGLSGKITLASALANITDNLTIFGNGRAATVIDGAALYRPFYVNAGKSLTISSLTLQRGQNTNGGLIYNSQGVITATDVRFTSMTSGSAVFNNNGTSVASYTNCTFDYLASGINGDYGSTPGIPAGYTSWNLVPDTVFTNRTYVTNCVFDRNTYGINNYRYTRIDNSTFTNNSNTGARVTGLNRTWISNSTFKGNGTGIYLSGSPQSTLNMGSDQRLVENNRFEQNSTAINLSDYSWVTSANSYRGFQAWSKVLSNQWDGIGRWIQYLLWNGSANSTLVVASPSSAISDFVHSGNVTVSP